MNAKELQNILDKARAETKGAFSALAAIKDLRSKVERLKREQVSAESDEKAEAAARELVSATDDLRVAEVILPRKQKAADDASQIMEAAGRDVLTRIQGHFGKLSDEGHDLAFRLQRLLISPEGAAGHPNESIPAMQRERALMAICGISIGHYSAWLLRHRAQTALSAESKSSFVPNAETLIESFDADTDRVEAAISKLKRTIDFLNADYDNIIESDAGTPAVEASQSVLVGSSAD